MISQIHELTGFQRDLLVTIDSIDEEPSGQHILSEIQPRYDTEITAGRLYPNLDQLVDEGLVERGEIDRRTNSYTLTDKGRDRLEEYAEFVAGE